MCGLIAFLCVEKLVRIYSGGHSHSHSAPTIAPVEVKKVEKKEKKEKEEKKTEKKDKEETKEEITNEKKDGAAKEEKGI